VEPIAETVLAAGGRKTVVARLRPFCPDSLLGPIAEAATFQRYDRKRKAWTETDPPLQLVRMILVAERRWPFPRVNGIITTPTLRSDGSLLANPGYDHESQLYLLPGFQLPSIPESPSKQEARAALKNLDRPVGRIFFQGVDRRGRKGAQPVDCAFWDANSAGAWILTHGASASRPR
jgi:putative DNA primase/helicase